MENDLKGVQTDLLKTESWLKQHEKLIIVVLILLSSIFVVNKGFNIIDKHWVDKTKAAQTTLQTQENTNKTLAEQVQSATENYQNQVAALTAQNQILENGIVSRDSGLKVQQLKDQSDTIQQLTNRVNQLETQGNAVVSNGGITLDATQAKETVTDLENVPVLKKDLADTNTELTDRQYELQLSSALVKNQAALITGLDNQLADQTKECKDEVSTIKAQARKSKFKWFGAGVIVGFIAGHVW
jgi:hypothetical protein